MYLLHVPVPSEPDANAGPVGKSIRPQSLRDCFLSSAGGGRSLRTEGIGRWSRAVGRIGTGGSCRPSPRSCTEPDLPLCHGATKRRGTTLESVTNKHSAPLSS